MTVWQQVLIVAAVVVTVPIWGFLLYILSGAFYTLVVLPWIHIYYWAMRKPLPERFVLESQRLAARL